MRTESEEREVEAGGAAALEAGGAVLPQAEEARKPDPCTEVLTKNNVNWPRNFTKLMGSRSISVLRITFPGGEWPYSKDCGSGQCLLGEQHCSDLNAVSDQFYHPSR